VWVFRSVDMCDVVYFLEVRRFYVGFVNDYLPPLPTSDPPGVPRYRGVGMEAGTRDVKVFPMT